MADDKPQRSKAPKPISPVSGGHAPAIASVNHPADWEKWGNQLTARLWEAVALWMDIEPETLSGHGISASFSDCPAEFKKLLDIAGDHAEHGTLHCLQLANSIPYSTVALANFADWHSTLSVKRPLPKDFPHKLPPPVKPAQPRGRIDYEAHVAEFRKLHDCNPPLETNKARLQGDRQWAVQNGLPRVDVENWRRELLGPQKLGRPKNPAGNPAKNNNSAADLMK